MNECTRKNDLCPMNKWQNGASVPSFWTPSPVLSQLLNSCSPLPHLDLAG